MARAWYSYNGIGDPLLIASYIFAPIKPACLNGVNICSIYTPNGGPNPSVLSANIRNYIANTLSTLVAQPDANPGLKKYVYGKN
ncbi:hypothetical protein [Pedobacter sp. UYP1]|uniref:hypothetical protein n=1 Tax=Pedobacter sp. UYP1 TaxID=1756396 RepID=UPI0033914039